MWPLLGAALVTGLLGSMHCIGMCGPLALAVACGKRGGETGRLLLFVIGKAGTYVGLGAAAGAVGAAFGQAAMGSKAAAVVALVAGTLMIALGFQSAWRLRPVKASGPSGLGSLLARVLERGGRLAPLLAGLLAGFLPCGLVYAMVARAVATGSVAMGGLVMAAFGVGTAPALVAAGWLGSRLSGRSRRLGEWIAAAAVIIMGLMVLWRGLKFLMADPSAAADGCHCH
jgi:uncharacterized protein